MICPVCNKVMVHTLRFEPDNAFELYKCNRCYFETKPKPYNDIHKVIQDNTKQEDKVKKAKKVKVNTKKNKKKKRKKK